MRDVSCEAAVYEAGFENHPGAVRALAARRVLWGNPPAVLARARDPRRLARVVGKAGLPAPRVRLTRPAPGVLESPQRCCNFLERYAEAYRRELDHFIGAIASRAAPLVGGGDGVKALALADAALESLRTGSAVRI